MMTSMRTLALDGALIFLLACADPTATVATTATGRGAGPDGATVTVARYPAAPAGRCAADNVPAERFCGP